MQPVFFKNLVSKLGLEVQVFRVGTYKSAVEPFIATEMSPANREQMTECLESVWHRILADVSDSRRIPTDTLNAYADRYMDFCQAEEYIQCKLADTLMYKDEVISYLKQLSGRDEDDKLNSLFIEDMINVKKDCPKNPDIATEGTSICCSCAVSLNNLQKWGWWNLLSKVSRFPKPPMSISMPSPPSSFIN